MSKFESPFAYLFDDDTKIFERARFEISLDPVTDRDIIKHLNTKANKSEYVRKLIRKDMRAHK